ncbi:hypothetical protein [Nocardia lasii]|uniref:Uncharacterized protein n=1 Tax=Nocardia lasii TaxID=1616107 RepID=A0ABW1JRI6_9NOCA
MEFDGGGGVVGAQLVGVDKEVFDGAEAEEVGVAGGGAEGEGGGEAEEVEDGAESASGELGFAAVALDVLVAVALVAQGGDHAQADLGDQILDRHGGEAA